MITPGERQAIVDEEHLRYLPVFYWVMGVMGIFFSLYGFVYIAMGAVFVWMPYESGADAPPVGFAWLFILMGVGFVLGFGGTGVFEIMAGFWIRKRTHRTACLVAAAALCMSVPFGTVIGVISFLVLLRPSVAALFESSKARPIAPAVAEAGEPVVDLPAAD